jgi:hypothetical protein
MEDKCDHDLFPFLPDVTPSLPRVLKSVKRKVTMTYSPFPANKEKGMLMATPLLSRLGEMEVTMTSYHSLPTSRKVASWPPSSFPDSGGWRWR